MKHQILIEYNTDDILKLIAKDVWEKDILLHRTQDEVEEIMFKHLKWLFSVTDLPSAKIEINA